MEENMVMDDNLCPLVITIVDGVESQECIDLGAEPTSEVVKKKRGRKKKEDNGNGSKPVVTDCGNACAKKRGRKPKGGKIVFKQPELNTKNHNIANIILHLKCSLNDLNEYNNKINKIIKNPLEYNPCIPPIVESYTQHDNLQFSSYNDSLMGSSLTPRIPSGEDNPLYSYNTSYNVKSSASEHNEIHGGGGVGGVGAGLGVGSGLGAGLCSKCSASKEQGNSGVDMKEINMKLKKIKINLYKNSCQDKKSACFWCTYDYDNPECYIPKHDINGKLYGYGSFCRPECAVAYLMKENIDDSTKFERYHLLNQIYSKVYNYKKNIKPAPNPYFLLEKYYGNLSIQEYRKLLKTEHMLLVIDKPMTRILPELHEDNELFVLGNMNNANNVSANNNSGVYKVKRQSEKNQTKNKNAIVKDNFGIQ